MRKLTPDEEQRMDDAAEAIIMVLSVCALLLLALLFIRYFPSIATLSERFMDWVNGYGFI